MFAPVIFPVAVINPPVMILPLVRLPVELIMPAVIILPAVRLPVPEIAPADPLVVIFAPVDP